MQGEAGFFDVEERLKELSAKGDDLERLNAIVDFEAFRADLAKAVPRSDGSKGGRPPFDHVFMFKILILQARHSISDERAEFLIKDRLSFMRFLGLGLSDAVPDANTIWTFREALTRGTDGEVLEGEALRRRLAAHRPRRAGFRVQKPRRYRPAPWADPHLEDNPRGPSRRSAAAQPHLKR